MASALIAEWTQINLDEDHGAPAFIKAAAATRVDEE